MSRRGLRLLKAFLDTSGVYALIDEDDRFHAEASNLWARMVARRDQLTTSNYVVIESLAILQRRLGLGAVARLEQSILPVAAIHWIDGSIHAAAVHAVLTAARRELSVVDCSSFLVMRMLGVRNFFGFDPHFTEHGFEPVS